MAQQHSAAYRLLLLMLADAVPPLELGPERRRRRVHEEGPRYGWQETADDWQETADDWRAVTEVDDIDVVDIVTPNDSHSALRGWTTPKDVEGRWSTAPTAAREHALSLGVRGGDALAAGQAVADGRIRLRRLSRPFVNTGLVHLGENI
jgi:hypothetical protein